MKHPIEWERLPVHEATEIANGCRVVIYNANEVFSKSKAEAERNVFCYRSDGTVLWRVATRHPMQRGSSFLVFDNDTAEKGRLYDETGSVYAVDLQTGNLEFLDWEK